MPELQNHSQTVLCDQTAYFHVWAQHLRCERWRLWLLGPLHRDPGQPVMKERNMNQVIWVVVPRQQELLFIHLTSYLIICKCDESKSTEWLGDEDISYFSILHKELPKVICGHVLCATAYKHFPAPQGLVWTLLWIKGGNRSIPQVTSINNVYVAFIPIVCRYMHGHYHIHLRVRELAVTPSSVNHVALGDHFFLRLILCEPHKAKSFGVSSLGIPFYLRQKNKHASSNESQLSPHTKQSHVYFINANVIPEPWWLLQKC